MAEMMDTDAIIGELDARQAEREEGRPRRVVVAACATPHPEDGDPNTDYCWLCGTGGNLVCCDFCSAAYHVKCIGETMSSLPDPWHCPECFYKGAFRNALRAVVFTFEGVRYSIQHGYLLRCPCDDRLAHFACVSPADTEKMMLALSRGRRQGQEEEGAAAAAAAVAVSTGGGGGDALSSLDEAAAKVEDVRHRSRLFDVLSRSFKNRFLRLHEKTGTGTTQWELREHPLLTAMCYVNKFEKAPYTEAVNVFATELGFAGQNPKDASSDAASGGGGFLSHKLDVRKRYRANAQRLEFQIRRGQLLSQKSAAAASGKSAHNSSSGKSTLRDPLDETPAELLRDGMTALEESLRPLQTNLPHDWCHQRWSYQVQQATTVLQFRECLLQLEAVLDERCFKPRWAGGKKAPWHSSSSSATVVVLAKSKKRKRASAVGAATTDTLTDGGGGSAKKKKKKPAAKKKSKSRVVAEDDDKPEYATCEKWMYTIESLRRLDVLQSERIKAVVQKAIQETAHEKITNQLKALLATVPRKDMTALDETTTLDMPTLFAARRIREGCLELLDDVLNTMHHAFHASSLTSSSSSSVTSSQVVLPPAFSNRNWLIADIREVSPQVAELIAKRYFYHRTTRETKWSLTYVGGGEDDVSVKSDGRPLTASSSSSAAERTCGTGESGLDDIADVARRRTSRRGGRQDVRREEEEEDNGSGPSSSSATAAAAAAASGLEPATRNNASIHHDTENDDAAAAAHDRPAAAAASGLEPVTAHNDGLGPATHRTGNECVVSHAEQATQDALPAATSSTGGDVRAFLFFARDRARAPILTPNP